MSAHRFSTHLNATSTKETSMQTSIARIFVEGLAPYSQSRQHDDPFLEGESHDAYERRTWASKMNIAVRDGKPTVVVPAHGLHQALAAGAKYSKRQIKGQGKATWTAKFLSGLALMEDPALGIDPATVKSVALPCNADGVRGSGRRVIRYFPVIDVGWQFTTDVYILDPQITEEIFCEMVEIAGLFIGIGRFRPEKGGTNGRFRLEKVEWADNRQSIQRAA
jgi:hypothetical protein